MDRSFFKRLIYTLPIRRDAPVFNLTEIKSLRKGSIHLLDQAVLYMIKKRLTTRHEQSASNMIYVQRKFILLLHLRIVH